MSDDAQRWKEKYLTSLEEQEKLERRWESRFDLLKRGLVRSSLAAEGSDKAVDQCMQELREIVRGDKLDAGLSGLIPRLEKAVLDSEERRRQRAEQSVVALNGLAGQLLKLDLPREVRKPLKQFAKSVDDRAGHVRELPLLLSELNDLQHKALEVLESGEAERPGLLQRLFGGRDSGGDAPEDAPPAAVSAEPGQVAPASAVESLSEPAATPSAASVEVARSDTPEAPVAALDAVPEAPLAALTVAGEGHAPVPPLIAPQLEERLAAAGRGGRPLSLDSLPMAAAVFTGQSDPAYALPALPEPGYSAVAPHVANSLLHLLDELELPPRHQPQGDALRDRLQGGLNWYELVPVLDDLAVLVLAVTDSDQDEFAGYLKQLNQRLVQFLGTLSAAHEGYADSLRNARALDVELREQVGDLQHSVQDALDLEILKRAVEQRLDGLLTTVNEYQRRRDQHEQEVTGRLQDMVQRMTTMEQEAKDFREHLDEQRQKALSDPLTGLPNRAAWSERLELEVARWQRYGGDLLLVVMDIDYFKRINDNYGHLAGDKVLKIVAGELAKRTRKTDFIARFGGEEFVLLVPGTPSEGGAQMVEMLRQAIAACPFHFKGEPVTITLSAGLSAFAPGDTPEAVFERADQALYRAKRGGRDRLELG